MAYQRPMVTVDQNMTVKPTSIEREQPAFVFGPNYELHRYEDAEERDGTYAGKYSPGDTPITLQYPNVVDEEAVDKGYTKLFGENVVVALTDGVQATYEDWEINEVQCGKLNFVVGDAKIKVGTLIKASVTDSASSGGPENSVITKVIAYVKASDATDAVPAGVYVEDQLADVGAGDEIEVCVVEVFNGVEFGRKDQNSPGQWQWEQPKDKLTDPETGEEFYGVRVNRLYVPISYGASSDPEYRPVISADLYVTFRELVTTYADTLHSVIGASEVANTLGVVHPDNPLAMGVYMAAVNAATDDGDEAPPVFFMATPTDDKDGYDHVLNRASLTDRIYVMAPTTRDSSVLDAVRSHVLAMSVKTVKQWRIAAASAEIPSEVARLDSTMDPQNDPFYAIVDSVNATNKTAIVKCVRDRESTTGNPDTSFRSTVVPGDKVRLHFTPDPWDATKEVYDTFTVKRVKNNYMVEVVDENGILRTTDSASVIEIYHEYTAAETSDLVASLSKAMASRRMLNVFPSVFSGNGMTMTGEFAACAVAGLVSATEPQQPITNVTVRGIDDIPLVYQQYGKADLDTMAAGGTFIICQDLPGDIVYVRHQITTAYSEGNINTAELSITKDVDSISYAFADVFRPYYGKYNITPNLISILRDLATTLIDELASSESLYGPQLIGDETVLKYVRQNELMKDHVDVALSIAVPYPCNNIDIVLTV